MFCGIYDACEIFDATARERNASAASIYSDVVGMGGFVIRGTRLVLFTICLCACVAFNWAFAQPRNSSSSRAQKSGSVQIAPGYGYAWIRGAGFDSLNSRLGNSALVQQPKVHGMSGYMGAHVWFPDGEFNKFWSVSVERISDSLTASGAGAEVSSQYSLLTAGAGYGVRLFPYIRGRFSPKDASTNTKSRSRGARIVSKFYLTGMINAEFAFFSQNYSLQVPSTNTKVAYKASGTHIVAMPTLRAAYVVTPAFHVIAEAAVGASKCMRTAATVDSVFIRGQDLRYRAAEAGVADLVTMPFQVIRGLVGITVEF